MWSKLYAQNAYCIIMATGWQTVHDTFFLWFVWMLFFLLVHFTFNGPWSSGYVWEYSYIVFNLWDGQAHKNCIKLNLKSHLFRCSNYIALSILHLSNWLESQVLQNSSIRMEYTRKLVSVCSFIHISMSIHYSFMFGAFCFCSQFTRINNMHS